MEGHSTPISLSTTRVCLPCKKQKRKCDKALPRCSACRYRNQNCTYSDFVPDDDISFIKQRLDTLESLLRVGVLPEVPSRQSDPSNIQSAGLVLPASSNYDEHPFKFPPLFVLDTRAWQKAMTPIATPLLSVPQELLVLLGTQNDTMHITSSYFNTVHTWLPMVWKRHFTPGFMHRLTNADLALLLACMKLVTDEPADNHQPLKSPLYALVRQFSEEMESSGLLSLHFIQAIVLISVYEVGHGIYPSAYMSIGRGIRLAQLMGCHDQTAPSSRYHALSRGEAEEQRRTWYSLLLLDRVVNMSFLGRSLCFGDFTSNDRLPCETELWDRGEVAPNEPLFVTSATSIKATPFGRLCQVALLLGRVINHRNDRQDATSAAKFVNAMQLQRTITALLRLVTGEFEQDPAAFCIPLAMGLSTKMVLCQIYSCNTHSPLNKTVEEADAQVAALTDLKTVPEEVASFHRRLTEQVDVSKIGPLICPCLYQAIVIITYFLRETCDRQLEKSRMPLINCLRILKGQWAVAGIYLDNVLSDNGISL